MTAGDLTTGRRVEGGYSALERGGDYSLVNMDDQPGQGRPCIIFLLPGARDDQAEPDRRSAARVCSPPHTFRECDDGSIEVRASILVHGNGGRAIWHGYLDEGHVWREV